MPLDELKQHTTFKGLNPLAERSVLVALQRRYKVNMPQTPMCTGFEACHVNRLIVFSQKPSPFLGCLLKIMYLCRVIQMTKE